MKKIITICAFAACLTGCDDLFEPAIENNLGLEYMYENSQYAEGILANAYTRIPCAGYSFNDVATDDAVSNDAENSWRKIASGMWTANNNPADRWTSCRSAIQYINLFLANADKVKWAKDEVVAQMFCDREKAEDGSTVLRQEWIEVSNGGDTKYTFKITPEMTPNVYLHISLLQPHAIPKTVC